MTIEESYKKRKLVVLTGIALILAASLILLGLIRARALSDARQEYDEYLKSITTELNDGMAQSISAMFFSTGDTRGKTQLPENASGIPSDIYMQHYYKASDVEQKADQFSTINRYCFNAARALDGDEGAGDIPVVRTIQNVLVGLGIFMVLIYSFISLFKELEKGDGTLDMWARCFVVVSIGFIIIFNFRPLLKAVTGLGSFTAERIYNATVSSGQENSLATWMNEYFKMTDDYEDIPSLTEDTYARTIDLFFCEVDFIPKVGDWLGDFFAALSNNIAVWFAIFGNKILLGVLFIIFEIPIMSGRIVLLTILIEMAIRRAFFPLAVAEIAGQGARSPGVVFMKKFFALYLRVGMCALISMIGTIIVNSVKIGETAGFIDAAMSFLFIFVIYTTVAKLYGATSGLANQVVGS